MGTTSDTVLLWRINAPCEAPAATGGAFSLVYPAARRGMTEALRRAGLSRNSLVAVPEWASYHVHSGISRLCSVTRNDAALAAGRHPAAYVCYEQWGWPFGEDVVGLLRERGFAGLVIVDSVDSCNLEAAYRKKYFPDPSVAEVFSLFKLLGLPGGGLLRLSETFAPYEPLAEPGWESLARDWPRHPQAVKLREFLKDESPLLLPEVSAWLAGNDLFAALRAEEIARHDNLALLLETGIGKSWPAWMRHVAEEGAAPGLFPALRGCANDVLDKAKRELACRLGVESSIYHFNFSGNPLQPEYALCLAVPMHGQATEHLHAICSLLQTYPVA